MPILETGKQNPKEDPHYPAAVKRVKEVARRLQEAGIIDAEGHRIRKDLSEILMQTFSSRRIVSGS